MARKRAEKAPVASWGSLLKASGAAYIQSGAKQVLANRFHLQFLQWLNFLEVKGERFRRKRRGAPFDTKECRRRCRNAIRNTATGKWRGKALKEIEKQKIEYGELEQLYVQAVELCRTPERKKGVNA